MTDDLFGQSKGYEPLAARMRPTSIGEYAGQHHMLAPGKPLRAAIDSGQLHSMILWGPPGVGKTTLARIAAEAASADFLQISAVLSGVKEIRESVARAQQNKAGNRDTVLFVDEVHRFNKSQQDAFLPYVEDGTLIFIGATTENPSFELNNALLSRARVYKLRALSEEELIAVLERGAQAFDAPVLISDEARSILAHSADGDARRILNLLELAVDLAPASDTEVLIDEAAVAEVMQGAARRFDKGGDQFYDQISALHKAVRGSSPDGALYWFCRMLDGGCDPLYIARRVVRMASEDIGNADPRALTLALEAWQVQERLGSPEGELTIAQAVVYMACAPKSNAVYKAFGAARRRVSEGGSEEVPLHLRNAPTQLMKEMEHGADYRYAHDEPEAYAAGESYLPEAEKDQRFYYPTDRGLEKRIREKLQYLRQLDKNSTIRRFPD